MTATFTTTLSDPSHHLNAVYVEEGCENLPYTREILSRIGDLPVKVVNEAELSSLFRENYVRSLNKGKRILFLSCNRGKFLKPCPATREYRCCDYQVINIGMNCPMDCVYCILQAYLNNPWLSFFVNTDAMLRELSEALAQNANGFMRIGTGEFTDSMALDRITGISRVLVEFMQDKSNAVLELKTKSAVIDNLKNLQHGGRTVTAWSLNSPVIMAREEIRTASLQNRLAAAVKCAEWGYRLAFHFDPIIYHPGWREHYQTTIEQLFATVPADRIAWISMGALRYLPHLKQIATGRFPGSDFFFEEFVPGLDGKMRYFRTLRAEMYKHIYDLLRAKAAPSTCIYLCMESDEIWREVFDFTPEERGGLPAMLDKSVV